MNEPLSPLMEKSKVKKRKKNRALRFVLSTLFFVVIILTAYFALDYFYIANAGNPSLLADGEALISPTPPVALNTLVPTDYVSVFLAGETPEKAYGEENKTAPPVTAQPMTAEPTPLVTPEPTPHPGVRDDVFTDGEIITDDMSYRSAELSIEISVVQKGESVAYVAEVYFASLDNFMPVFANGRFDNGYQTTSEMAEAYNAVFAVNSDSSSVIDYGIVIRDGEIYRDIVAADHLAIFGDGSLKTYLPVNISAETFLKKGAVHVFNFGPLLLYDGKSKEFPYSHIRSANPRTAIGMIEPYHYYFVVVDGRCEYSKGMTMEELSLFMEELGCVDAYNLDGGGSSTMVFMGELINKPEGGSSEREIDGAICLWKGLRNNLLISCVIF